MHPLRHRRRGLSGRLLLLLALLAWGCSDPVPDIDRTQGNLIPKADLDGEWHMLQTVVGVPPTSAFTFIGETSVLERVRFEIRRDMLVAYRSYPRVRGALNPSTDDGFDGTENPVAAWPILAHVDIIRSYNASTGEQSNVLVEDYDDRLWHERDYVRVDWSQSLVPNFDFIAPTVAVTAAADFTEAEEGGGDALYRESRAGQMSYFDMVQRLWVQPDIWGCIYTWWGYSAEDCTAAEIEVRASFARVEPRQYEPFHYDDQLMARFGYFRTEYFTYDEQRGITDQGRRYLINRHGIWQRTRTDEGALIPMSERRLRPVPYYLSPAFPDDPLLLEAAEATMTQWNDALRVGLDAAGVTDTRDVFVLCHNPVAEGDPTVCGERGFAPRMGDLRFSTLHWVDPETLTGLLGYGPSAADPISGEIISGKAYVYGAAVSTWASYAVDVIRYFNDQLDLDTLIRGEHFTDEVIARLEGRGSRPRPAAATDRMRIDRPFRGKHRRPARPQAERRDLRPYDPGRIEARLDAARAAGATPMLLHDEVGKAILPGVDLDALSPEERAKLDPTRILEPLAIKRMMAHREAARARSADMHDLVAPDIEGLVQRYLGRTDYEQIWREIRAEIFAATAEHEVGHTVGLRHNFQASYDSLNYFDDYWALREETLLDAESLGDIYHMVELTDDQRAGLMRQKQYSSIMDYGYSWHNDLNGLGKYDRAALIFGYTADARQTPAGVRMGPGLVEVFEKDRAALGEAGALLDGVEDGFTYDDPGLPSITALERYHYTTLANAFPSLEDIGDTGRRWMAYDDYLAEKSGSDRPVRVPYLFCSDEWEGGLVSCHAFDQGADPFEIVRSRVAQYRAYYPFVNYRRDNPFFDVWHPLIDYYYRVFLPLSDVFQSWYVAPYGDDALFDRTYDLAINTGFNLLAEVMSTPPYGQWCESTRGTLLHLSDAPELQGLAEPDPACDPDGQRFEIEPGVGRRPFSVYDTQAGYYFPDKPLEAGHYWATLAAVWAITDPDAFILGADGDAGVYAISFYDWFPDEFEALMNQLLAKDYAGFAPRALRVDGVEGLQLQYPVPAPIYDAATGGLYDPETGARSGPFTGGPVGLCSPCEADADCAGYTGFLGGTYCQPAGDGTDACLRDCTNDPGLCGPGTACDAAGNCVPEDGICAPLAADCSPEAPLGDCEAGTCVDGVCIDEAARPVVEAEPTFALATDILWYGFLFTTASYSTRFNDQLNVFRPGSDGEVEVEDPALSERVVFTDPLSGVAYAAVQGRCEAAVTGGSVGLCGPCEADAECVGHTGFLGGTYCQPIGEAEDGPFYCLQDCTDDPGLCPDDTECDPRGNCVPARGICLGSPACAPDAPLGGCPEGETCVEGACVPRSEPSAHCRFQAGGDTGAVGLLRRGQGLAAEYDAALEAWYTHDASADPEEDNRLARLYYRARYALTNHVDLLETLIATYRIFGRVY